MVNICYFISGSFIYYYKYGLSFIFLSLILLNSIIGVFLSFYFFTVPKIDYVRLEKSTLSIHRGFPVSRKKIIVSNIEKGNIEDDKLVLILNDENQVELKSKFISIDNFEELKKYIKIE